MSLHPVWLLFPAPHALFHGFGRHRFKAVRGGKLPALSAPISLKAQKKAQTDQGPEGGVFVEATVGGDMKRIRGWQIMLIHRPGPRSG